MRAIDRRFSSLTEAATPAVGLARLPSQVPRKAWAYKATVAAAAAAAAAAALDGRHAAGRATAGLPPRGETPAGGGRRGCEGDTDGSGGANGRGRWPWWRPRRWPRWQWWWWWRRRTPPLSLPPLTKCPRHVGGGGSGPTTPPPRTSVPPAGAMARDGRVRLWLQRRCSRLRVRPRRGLPLPPPRAEGNRVVKAVGRRQMREGGGRRRRQLGSPLKRARLCSAPGGGGTQGERRGSGLSRLLRVPR